MVGPNRDVESDVAAADEANGEPGILRDQGSPDDEPGDDVREHTGETET